MKILIFDNYDSFTYNLVHLIKDLNYKDIEVHRNDKIDLNKIDIFDKIIISPGPGIPSEAGILLEMLKTYHNKKHIFGVCLGHQAIGEYFGGKLINLDNVYHGVSSEINILKESSIFKDIETKINVGRYHSWTISNENFPNSLEITAKDKENEIMALEHKTYPIYGVQFHPESILTKDGSKILENFLKLKI